MFGYIKADLSSLNEENTELYRAVYCSLCEALKKHYGLSARFILNYDITFLALLRLNTLSEQEQICEHYCPYKGKKCTILENRDAIFLECASVLIILAYEKLLDNVRDEKGVKKLLFRLLAAAFAGKYRKAKIQYPVLSDIIRYNMTLQEQIEATNPSVDKAAHPTADSLGVIFRGESDSDRLYRFGYTLGRWIYYADAADDIMKDKRCGAFNPFKAQISNDRIQQILNLSIGEACECYELLEKGKYSPIMENILYEGSLRVQAQLPKGEEK